MTLTVCAQLRVWMNKICTMTFDRLRISKMYFAAAACMDERSLFHDFAQFEPEPPSVVNLNRGGRVT